MKPFYTLTLICAVSLMVPNAALAKQRSHPGQGPFSGIRCETRKQVQDFQAEQQQKRKEFFESVKDLSPQDRQQAVIKHMEEQEPVRKKFFEDLHAANLAKLTQQLSENPDLSDEKKQDILASFNARHQERLQQRNARYTERKNQVLEIIHDENLTAEQKEQRLREYRKEKRGEDKIRRHGKDF